MEKRIKMVKSVQKLLLGAIAIAVIVLLAIIGWAIHYRNRTVVAGWGDSAGGRSSYTLSEVNAGALKNEIVFNSISDSQCDGGNNITVMCNERNFVGARLDNGQTLVLIIPGVPMRLQ